MPARSAVLGILALGLTTALAAQQAVPSGQRVSLTERRLDIYAAAGTVTLHHGSGDAVVIVATAQGPDGGQLKFEADHQGERGRFRVVFPEVDAIASPEGRSGSTDLDLRRDGTFGGDDAGDDGWRRGRHGDRIRVGGTRGFHGWASLEVMVPDGREVKVHLAVGHASADGVNGDVTLDTWSADAEATDISGNWLLDIGSGRGSVRGMRRGALKIDTGSGNASASDITADVLDLDTGSGGADATNVRVDRLRVDTGSGGVRIRGLVARRGSVDTGSGGAEIVYADGPIEDLAIDVGSGHVDLTLPRTADARVSLDTRNADVQRAGAIFERRDEDGMVLRFGEGRGRIRIETGSGGVTIR